jgi:predicted MPP superfamily phosphohydrolase/Flp pilus assembly protein TadD
METLFTWVHLSDLHVRASGPGERFLEALRGDLEARAGERTDALLVSGDVAWSGQREDYVAADAFLVRAARAVGLDPDRVFVIPGNHDVDRSEGTDDALEHTRAREVLSSRLYAFSVFAATFGPPLGDDAADERLWWSHRLEARDGVRVRIVGLCSAFLTEGDDDRGALRIGEMQLAQSTATIAPGELVIALSHHPARGGWLADERDVVTWLGAHAHVHLSGHPHDPIADEARAGMPGPFVWIAAGETPPKRQLGPWTERNFSYAVASIMRHDDGSLCVRVTPRCWSSEKNRFVEGTLRDSPLDLARPEPIFARPEPTLRGPELLLARPDPILAPSEPILARSEPLDPERSVGDPRRFAADLATSGLALRRKGNVAEAIDCLERALAIHEKLGPMDGHAEVLGGLGLCLRDVGELDRAVDHFQRALALHEQRGDRAGQAGMLGNLGNAYRARGALDRAVDHLERALAIYDDLGLSDGQGAALSNLGLCYRALGKLTDARDRYERALAIFDRLGLPESHPHLRMVSSALAQLRAPSA